MLEVRFLHIVCDSFQFLWWELQCNFSLLKLIEEQFLENCKLVLKEFCEFLVLIHSFLLGWWLLGRNHTMSCSCPWVHSTNSACGVDPYLRVWSSFNNVIFILCRLSLIRVEFQQLPTNMQEISCLVVTEDQFILGEDQIVKLELWKDIDFIILNLFLLKRTLGFEIVLIE